MSATGVVYSVTVMLNIIYGQTHIFSRMHGSILKMMQGADLFMLIRMI